MLESDYPNYSKMFIFYTGWRLSQRPGKLGNSVTWSNCIPNRKNELKFQPDINMMIKIYLEVIRKKY